MGYTEFDEANVKFYDELNIGYGTEEEKAQITKELEDELGEFLTQEELEIAIYEQTHDIIANKNIRVKLLCDYRKWAPDCFVKGAEGIVKEWKFFRFRSYTWNYAYVLVEIDGYAVPVNIDKLEVLDKDFLKAEKNFFLKFKDTYEYVPEDNLLKLDDKIELHCTALVNRILDYLED